MEPCPICPISSLVPDVLISNLSSNLCSWCERGDSNPHTFRYQILSLARLPIPPLSHSSENSTAVDVAEN